MMVVVEGVGGGGGGIASSGPMYTEGRQNTSTIGRAYYMYMYRCWHMTKSLFTPEQERIRSKNW